MVGSQAPGRAERKNASVRRSSRKAEAKALSTSPATLPSTWAPSEPPSQPRASPCPDRKTGYVMSGDSCFVGETVSRMQASWPRVSNWSVAPELPSLPGNPPGDRSNFLSIQTKQACVEQRRWSAVSRLFAFPTADHLGAHEPPCDPRRDRDRGPRAAGTRADGEDRGAARVPAGLPPQTAATGGQHGGRTETAPEAEFC
ncbi:unnamed protein product [Rangifer tarandus platyrhynchus]|uniref:Uncharacterized protein n=1 Tax=Rangifer tarandus platyrhynchus TaxID=3082113 RepID=A0AC59Y727_RANTA